MVCVNIVSLPSVPPVNISYFHTHTHIIHTHSDDYAYERDNDDDKGVLQGGGIRAANKGVHIMCILFCDNKKEFAH